MVEEARTFANRDDVLEACSNRNILKLRDTFHNSHRLGQDQTSAFAPPMESSLIEAMMDRAIQHDQPDILRYILTFSSGLKIPESAVRWALLLPSIEMYDILSRHDPSIISQPISEGRETQLGKALNVPALPEKNPIPFLLRPST